jgi:hypothetical protein
MERRIFKDSWSPAMKQTIANMTSTEYKQFEKECGISEDVTETTDSPVQSYVITAKDIEAWAKNNSKG